MKRNQNAVKVSGVFLVNSFHRRFLRSLRFSLTKKRLSCCRSWPGRMGWLCDDDECDYYDDDDDEDHDDKDGNDEGDNYDTWVRKATSSV